MENMDKRMQEDRVKERREEENTSVRHESEVTENASVAVICIFAIRTNWYMRMAQSVLKD
jgi:uncharacterized membrane protein